MLAKKFLIITLILVIVCPHPRIAKSVMAESINDGYSRALDPNNDTPGSVLANSKSGDLIMYGEPNLYDTMKIGDENVAWPETSTHLLSRRVIENFLNDRLKSSSEFELGYRAGDKITIPLNSGFWEGNTVFDKPSGINFTGRTNISSGGFPGGGQPYFEQIVPSMSEDRVIINNGTDFSIMVDAWDIPNRPSSWTTGNIRSAFSTNSTQPEHASLVPIFASRYGINQTQYNTGNDEYRVKFYGDSSNSQWLEIERLNTTFDPAYQLPFESYIDYYGRYNSFGSRYQGNGKYNWVSGQLITHTGKFTVRGDIQTKIPDELSVVQKMVPTYKVGQKITKEEIQKNIQWSGNNEASSLDILGDDLNYMISSNDVGENSLRFTLQESLDDAKRSIEFNFQFNVEKEEVITATAIPQDILLGEEWEGIDPYDLITNVKLGDQALTKDDYEISVQNSVLTSTVGDKTAKVLITYKKDTGKKLLVDVPISVLWGNTVHLRGAYSKSVIALSLLNKDGNYQITASKGEETDGGRIHETSGTYIGIETYSLSSFNTQLGNNLEQNYSIDIDGRVSKDTAYKLIKSPLSVKIGDVLKIYHKQFRSYPGLVELYTGSVKQANPNGDRHMNNDNLYLQITEDGFKILNFNQLESKSVSIPIYSTQEYLEEHIEDYIDLKGYKNLSVKEFSQYPNTKSSGTQKGKIIVEELLSTGKKVQYEYEVTFTIQEGELTLSAPKILDFQDFSKSKLEQLIQRKKIADLGLSVKDSRGDGKQGGWRVTARVNQSEELAPYLIFRDGNTEDQYLNQGAVEIYSQSKQGESVEPINVEVSGEWTKDTGILLKVPSKNNLSSEKYTSTITWNLVEGP